MKQLLIGIGIGVAVSSLIFSMTGSKETPTAPVAAVTIPSQTPVATPDVANTTTPPAMPTAKTSVPSMQTPGTEVATSNKAKPGETPAIAATGKEGATDTKKFVPPLFSGTVEGFPKLDEKTKKTLESAQQKVSMNQPEAAIEDLENALKEEPTNGYFAVELAMMQSDLMKNPRRSEEILSDHLRRDPESKMVSAAYADFLSQHGREREATPYFARAAAGNAPTEAYAQYGHHLMRMHSPDKAADAYRSAFERTQQDLEAKVSRNESTVIAKQELFNRAIDLGHAERQRGNEAGWMRMVEVASKYGPENDPQLKILRNANTPNPAQPGKAPSE